MSITAPCYSLEFHSKVHDFRRASHSAKPVSFHCFFWVFRLTRISVTQTWREQSRKFRGLRAALWPSTRASCPTTEQPGNVQPPNTIHCWIPMVRAVLTAGVTNHHALILSLAGQPMTITLPELLPPGNSQNSILVKFKHFTRSVSIYAKTSLWKVKIFPAMLHIPQQISSMWMFWGLFLCCQNAQNADLHY